MGVPAASPTCFIPVQLAALKTFSIDWFAKSEQQVRQAMPPLNQNDDFSQDQFPKAE